MKNLKTKIVIFLLASIFVLCACEKDDATTENVGEVRLNIETYLAGKDQVTHPSLISFEEEWNGFKYWMAYTPYPYASGEEENPCIAVSNDLYKWETPEYFVNPIADNEETGCNELKDSHIVYREDLDRIEMWYLGRESEQLGGDGSTLLLFRKYSYDGITWSDYEIMMETKYLSPSIRWDGSKYQCWAIGFDTYETTGTLVYQESEDGKNWTTPKRCSIGGQDSDLELWHGSVDYDEGYYHFTYIEDGSDSQEIKYCESKDGIEFSAERVIVKNDKKSLWDRFYRPYTLVEEQGVIVLYGVITENNEWYISMSKGDSVDSLVGISDEDTEKMVVLDTVVTDTRTVKYILKDIYHYMQGCIRFELAAIVLILILLFRLLKKHEKIIFILAVVFCNLYTVRIAYPTEIIHYLSVLLIGTMEALILVVLAKWLNNLIVLKKNNSEIR